MILFLCLLPVMLLAALLIKLTMPGPVLFVQQRIGRYGRPFRIYKFRSMVVNNESIAITTGKDKRITPFGQVLRTTKVDEFPQLINILKGEMSFVGPRPDLPGYYDTLTGKAKQVLNLRPGLTGLDSVFYPYEEQIMAHQPDPSRYYREVLWPHKVRINLWYYHNRSFWLDIKIMLNTLTIVIFGKKIGRFHPIP